MNFDNFSTQTNTRERDLAMQKAMPVLMRKVFTWMTMALVITGITAYFLSTSPAMMQMLYTSRMPILICAIIEVGIVFLCIGTHKQAITAKCYNVVYIVFYYQWGYIRLDIYGL